MPKTGGPAGEGQEAPGPGPGDPGVWMMALGLTFGSMGMGFAMGPMLLPVHEATGWSKPAIAAGITISMLSATLASPLIGRQVDRGRAVEVMTLAAVWGGLMLIMVGQARSLTQWYLAWSLVGPGFAGMLYEPSFAFFNRRLGAKARGAIIRMTLVAGFTSSFSFIFGAVATELVGWRGAWVSYGLLCCFGAAPLYWLGGQRMRRGERAPQASRDTDKGALKQALSGRAFWMLGFLYGLVTLNHAMLLTMAIPMFTQLGAGPVLAVTVAALIGPFQVLGRFGLMLAGPRARPRPAMLAVILTLFASALCLLAAGLELWLILAFAALQGTAIGITSILRPLLSAEIFGSRGFGAITGSLSIGGLVASALAPFLGALVFAAGETQALALAAVLVAGLALALCLTLPRRAGAEVRD